jgi:DegV family protein with EDD domain
MASKVIRFVTDSTCDIPADLIRKYQIGVVPAFVNYGGRSYADDGVELDRVTYYNELHDLSQQPTTAAPSPGMAEKVIKRTFEGADHLVMLTVPAALSGLYNTLRLGASDLPPDRVTLIDSGTVSLSLGFQVLIGAEVAEQTGDVSAVLAAIEGVRRHQKLYAAPHTMEYLRRSGRVSWARAGAAALLQIKPIISVGEGEVGQLALVRTFNRAVDKLIDLAKAEAPLDRLALLHANNPEGAQEMKNRLGSLAPANTFIINVTPTIGTHIGPGSLGMATVSEGWKRGL